MNDTEKAYEANGKLRSELARYKTAHDKQQQRIRELETENVELKELAQLVFDHKARGSTKTWRDRARVILEGRQ